MIMQGMYGYIPWKMTPGYKSVKTSTENHILICLERTRIGSPFHGNDDNGNFSGHVRVYTLANDTWVQIGQDILLRKSVSLSSDGSIIAIGADGNDDNGNLSGHVRVYTLENDTWVQIGQDIDGEAVDDESGKSVSLSSDRKP